MRSDKVSFHYHLPPTSLTGTWVQIRGSVLGIWPAAFQGRARRAWLSLPWWCHGMFYRQLGGKSHSHQLPSMFQRGDGNLLEVAYPLWIGAVRHGSGEWFACPCWGPTFSFYTGLHKSCSWPCLTCLPTDSSGFHTATRAWGGLLKFHVHMRPLFWNRVKALSVFSIFCLLLNIIIYNILAVWHEATYWTLLGFGMLFCHIGIIILYRKNEMSYHT